MPLYSVQQYVRGLIDGAAMPQGIPGPLKAWITPPVQEKVKAPRAHVWAGRVQTNRQAGPRGPGLKKRPWIIDVYLVYMDAPTDALRNEPFAKVVDVVTDIFETTLMPVFIDPEGNVKVEADADASCSQIQAIGESWSLDYPPERTSVSQRQLWYTGLVRLDVLEVRQR